MVNESSSVPGNPLHRAFYQNLLEKSIEISSISFDDSNRFIDEETKATLIQSTATRLRFSSRLKEDPAISLVSNQRILLVGPKGSQIHQLHVVRCLANHFSSKLLVLDCRMIFYGGFGVSLDERSHDKFSKESLERNLLFELHQVLDAHSKTGNSLILFLPTDVSSIFRRAYKHDLVCQDYMNFPSNIVIIGSSYGNVAGKPYTEPRDFFMHEVMIRKPRNKLLFEEWQKQLDNDAKKSRRQANYDVFSFILNLIGYTCTDLSKVCFTDKVLNWEDAALISGWALSRHFADMHDPDEGDQKSISAESIEVALDLFVKAENLNSMESNKSIHVDNFEASLLNNIMTPKDIGVIFEDIGGLEEVKGVLTDFILIPLKTPGLCRGELMRCKGILLIGPPGTGKTMIAKAVAAEAGANLINISLSTFISIAVGERTKSIKAVFTIATKIAPCVIFVDEVDTILGKKGISGDESIKNEFMMLWDNLHTKDEDCIVVLAATNRPFELDESVIRRFTRRLMMNLPDAINREKILKIILGEEEMASDVDLGVVANMTEGYSGSDLKNVCVVAAHCRVTELRQEEKKKSLASEGGTEVRALKMEDFTFACEIIHASVSADPSKLNELVLWNDMFGEGSKSSNGGSLSYFL